MAAASGSTTVGVTGQRWRASVTPWGDVTPWAGSASRTLEWYVAADDRWHRPAVEPAVRQHRIDGTPVTETRLRVPDGDAVQRVWSVANGGGLTIIEVENDSPLPFAVAFSGIDVLTERTPADMPIQGIDLPDDAITLPVGHRSSIRVAIPHTDSPGRHGAGLPRSAVALSAAPGASEVVRGWTAITARAGRLELPDDGLAEAVVAARCDVMLDGPADPGVDPLGFVLDVGELVRCGDAAAEWLAEIIAPLESMAKSGDPLLAAACTAAERVALAAGDNRAAADITRLRARIQSTVPPIGPFSELRRVGAVGSFVHDVERHLASGGDILPAGIPTRWFGSNFEVHGVPTSATSSVSYAVRWHGERAAVLWEQSGTPQRLTASAVDDGWATSAATGEALWAAPARRPPSALAVRAAPLVATGGSDTVSFS